MSSLVNKFEKYNCAQQSSCKYKIQSYSVNMVYQYKVVLFFFSAIHRLCPLSKKKKALLLGQVSEKPSSSPLLHFLVCFCYTTTLTSFPLIQKPKTCAFSHLAQGMLTLAVYAALLLVTLLRPDSPCVSLQLLVNGQMDHRLPDSVCRGSRLFCFIHLV